MVVRAAKGWVLPGGQISSVRLDADDREDRGRDRKHAPVPRSPSQSLAAPQPSQLDGVNAVARSGSDGNDGHGSGGRHAGSPSDGDGGMGAEPAAYPPPAATHSQAGGADGSLAGGMEEGVRPLEQQHKEEGDVPKPRQSRAFAALIQKFSSPASQREREREEWQKREAAGWATGEGSGSVSRQLSYEIGRSSSASSDQQQVLRGGEVRRVGPWQARVNVERFLAVSWAVGWRERTTGREGTRTDQRDACTTDVAHNDSLHDIVGV